MRNRIGLKTARLAIVMCVLMAGVLASAIPAGAVDIRVGGYAKLDMMYSDKIKGFGLTRVDELAGIIRVIPLDGQKGADHGSFVMDAKESRINVTATQDVSGAKVTGVVEGDFYSYLTNDTTLHLRQAYAKVELPSGVYFVAGQTWNNFMSLELYPSTIDFGGVGENFLFGRNPMVLVGYKASDLNFSASAEDSKVFSLNIPGNFVPNQGMPLLTGKVTYTPKFITVVAGAAYDKNQVIDRVAGNQLTKNASGVFAGVSVPAGPVTLVGQAKYIDGLHRLAYFVFDDAVVINNELQNIKAMGFTVGASFKATPEVTLNGYYGYNKVKDDAAGRLAQFEKAQTVHVNVLKKMFSNMQVGLEYQNSKVDLFNGTKGSMNRVQSALWYFF